MKTNSITNVRYDGNLCSGTLDFDYKGEHVHANKFSKLFLWEALDSLWTEKDVYWAFILPDLSNGEKSDLLEILRGQKDEILKRCENCGYTCLELTPDLSLREKAIQYVFSIGSN